MVITFVRIIFFSKYNVGYFIYMIERSIHRKTAGQYNNYNKLLQIKIEKHK